VLETLTALQERDQDFRQAQLLQRVGQLTTELDSWEKLALSPEARRKLIGLHQRQMSCAQP
jgi:lipopolysaccharide biosynthesis regulator YciM